jgi:hypothetical protein
VVKNNNKNSKRKLNKKSGRKFLGVVKIFLWECTWKVERGLEIGVPIVTSINCTIAWTVLNNLGLEFGVLPNSDPHCFLNKSNPVQDIHN